MGNPVTPHRKNRIPHSNSHPSRSHNCIAGIMVTASHNPKDDNGYKVYWGNAAQIIPPHDHGIAQCIDQCKKDPDNDIHTLWLISPNDSRGDEDAAVLKKATDRVHQTHLVIDPLPEVMQTYYSTLLQHLHFNDDAANSESSPVVRFVYTPMHGVGLKYAERAFETMGLPKFDAVPLQADADPEFPTVKFPNPEEGKSALNLSMELAKETGAKVILANDPDADRLAVAEWNPKKKRLAW